ncbi:MAG: OmpA family protein [Bradyrhizobiaceae bacterium]|nr:OmpA family protein [Bradyrhizobiaceae bacterium]
MTDMMVGMLFIFIILLMSFALLFRQQTDATRATQTSKIEHANDIERRLEELEKKITQQIDRVREATLLRQRLLRDIDARLRRDDLIVQVDESNGVLHLTEDTIRFQQNDASLNDRARQNVGKIARALAQVLPGYVACPKGQSAAACPNQANASVETVFIEGHTDTTGSDDQNWVLSAQRAANTYRELAAVARELRQFRNRNNQELLSISGYSSTRPIDPAGTPAAWEKNRRIDLRFVMDTDVTPGLEQIQGLLGQMRSAIHELKEAP